MKKILSLFTLVFAAFTLMGCDLNMDVPGPEPHTVTLASDYEDATLTQTPEGPHEAGEEITVSASWEDGDVTFLHWEEDGDILSEDATFTYTVTENATLDAVFEEKTPETFTLAVDVNVEEPSFTVNPEGPYEEGDTVTVTLDYDKEAYTFVEWLENDQFLSDVEKLEYTVTKDATLKAIFEDVVPETFTLTISANVQGPSFTLDFEGPYEAGDTVTITPDYDENAYVFVEWLENDQFISDDEVLEYTVTEDVTLEAVFEEIIPETFTLTVGANVQGPSFNLDPEGPYEAGDTVTVTPDYDKEAYVFVEWRDDGTGIGGDEMLDYTVESDATLEAVFEPADADIEPATYTETFEDFYSTGSQYRDFTQIGVNGIEWHFTDTRTDIRFDSVSDAVTLGDTPARNASMTALIPEGISYFNVYYENAFSSPAGFELYINDTLIGTAPEVEGTIGFFEVDDLDIKGEFELKILPTNGQLTLDDLTWENNVPGSDYPVVSFESPYWDAEFDADPSERLAPGSEVSVTATDPEGLYNFLRWEDGEGQTISEENPYTFTLEEDTLLYAVFDNPPAYTLRLESNYYLADLSKTIDRPVVEGTEVTVTANDPENQYGFIGWEDEDGTLLSEQESFTYTTTDTDMTLTAFYDIPEPIDYEDMTLSELTSLDLDRYDGYYSDLEGLHGDALRDEIQSMMQSQISYRSYDEARQILQKSDRDPDNHDHVIQIYTRQSVPGEWDGGSTWNREHVWPSRRFPGERTSKIGTDLHHLAPADPGENSSRGYKFFDWDTTSTAYEPHDDVKGDVSRMMFYMDVMYDELTLVDEDPDADLDEMGNLETMLQWHVLDEVSHFEMYRNDVIEDHQNNRNPFIDYPHLAYLVYYDHHEVGLD